MAEEKTEEKVELPHPNHEYLHSLSQLHPYRKDINKRIKKIKVKQTEDGKADIEDLVKKIMGSASESVGAHFGDKDDVHLKLDYERLVTFLEENEKEILDEGELSDEIVQGLVSQYVSTADQYIIQKYGLRLRQLHIDDAKAAVKELAKFSGNEQHDAHIDNTAKVETLVNRVHGRYHQTLRTKVEDMIKENQFIEKPGYLDFMNYKTPEVAKPAKYKDVKSKTA